MKQLKEQEYTDVSNIASIRIALFALKETSSDGKVIKESDLIVIRDKLSDWLKGIHEKLNSE